MFRSAIEKVELEYSQARRLSLNISLRCKGKKTLSPNPVDNLFLVLLYQESSDIKYMKNTTRNNKDIIVNMALIGIIQKVRNEKMRL